MDKYITIIKSSSSLRASKQQEKSEKKQERKYSPYSGRTTFTVPDEVKYGSRKTQTKYLLSTLKGESNPITHSDIMQRTDFIVSMSSGHQVSECGRPNKEYMQLRREKLANQREAEKAAPSSKLESSGVLKGTRIYIDGYLANTTDIEMKRTVTLNGGEILLSASNATHILTSQSLSGSKVHRILTKKMRVPVQVVKPEWVWDSLEAGKKLPEYPYLAFKSASAGTLPFTSAVKKGEASSSKVKSG